MQDKYIKIKKIKMTMADDISDPKKQNGDDQEKHIKLAVYRHLAKEQSELWMSFKNYKAEYMD